MHVPSLTSPTTGVFSYVYNQITGEDGSAGTSGYWNVFPNGMWVTNLPTTNYEPLDVPREAQVVAEKVGVSFFKLSLLFQTCVN